MKISENKVENTSLLIVQYHKNVCSIYVLKCRSVCSRSYCRINVCHVYVYHASQHFLNVLLNTNKLAVKISLIFISFENIEKRQQSSLLKND